MSIQSVFKRYELKYLLTKDDQAKVLKAMESHMALDKYGRTTIRNLYFDTDTYRLIRRSIEKPAYKEKLRVRSYEKVSPDASVFVELKKKYKHVVYKRRIAMPEKQALRWLCEGQPLDKQSQIYNEIDYFAKYYGTLHPTVFLSYEREAYYAKDGSDFRVTFDDHILCRQTDLSLEADVFGDSILDDGYVLMELKCSGGVPLWMAHILSELHLYKTSFSKYGTAYEKLIFPKLKEDHSNGIII